MDCETYRSLFLRLVQGRAVQGCFAACDGLFNVHDLFALAGRGAEVLRFRKPTFAKPAPADLRHEITVRCEAVVEALAD